MQKIVLIVDSLDKMFPADNKIHGGANRVGRRLIEHLIKLNRLSIDIICKTATIDKLDGINKIYTLNICPFGKPKLFFEEAKKIINKNHYDQILTSDLFAPYGNLLIHSHTLMYKNKNCKNFLEQIILFFLRQKKIKNFKNNFIDKNRKVFVVSKKVANDYIENLGFEKDNVIYTYPGVDFQPKEKSKINKVFTYGIVAGNAINKGGYLFIFAIFILKFLKQNFKAKMILNKPKKTNLMNLLINFLHLSDKIEIIPEQVSLEKFYKSIDCLVVPSLNEAFGLIATEAASYSKPALVSATAGAAEIITDKENGFIFERKICPTHSLINLIYKMKEILKLDNEEIKKISDNSYKLSTTYSWDNFTQKIIQELNL